MDGWLCSLSFFGFGLKSLAKLLFAILMSLKSSRNGFEPTRLRDWAVKFLVLKEIEAREPVLATGRSHALVFTPAGDQLVFLSEEEDELTFWDVEQRRRLTRLPLRGGAGTMPQAVAEASSGEGTTSSRGRTTGGGATGAIAGSTGLRSGPAPGAGGPGGRP